MHAAWLAADRYDRLEIDCAQHTIERGVVINSDVLSEQGLPVSSTDWKEEVAVRWYGNTKHHRFRRIR